MRCDAVDNVRKRGKFTQKKNGKERKGGVESKTII